MENSLLGHRVGELEKDVSNVNTDIAKLEDRMRTLEIAWARLVGLSAGGAIFGGALVQVVQWLMSR